MGWQTLAIIGLNLFKADREIRASEKQAEATVRQAELENEAVVEQTNLENQERLKRVRALAAEQKVSFLNSGLKIGRAHV